MVWSDQRILELSREFVPVAAEAYLLYPENPEHLARVADDPAHRFFRAYGEAMPAGDWHHPGSKQGVYLIGPNGEYLEGRFAASEGPDVRARMERGLERWRELRKQRKYAAKPVPARAAAAPPEFADAPALLRVSLRDLAGDGPRTTPRWRPGAFDDANWIAFTQWAWNQDWRRLDDVQALLPAGERDEEVDGDFVRRLCREVFVDRVRGQAPAWEAAHVRGASMRMRRVKGAGRGVHVEYVGDADLGDGERGMRVRWFGRAVFDEGGRKLASFELAATGLRRGAYSANQRAAAPGPSPIGFALRLVPAEGTRGPRK
jgi:hypothetical protein